MRIFFTFAIMLVSVSALNCAGANPGKGGNTNTSVPPARQSASPRPDLPNGTLIRRESNAGGAAVYVMVDGARHHVANPDVFAALGFKWEDVKRLPDGEVEGILERGRINSPEDYYALIGGKPPQSGGSPSSKK